MPLLSLRGRIAISLTFCLIVAGTGAWLCERSDAIAFLSARSGGEWIVAPLPPQGGVHMANPTTAVFKRIFTLNSVPASARLSLCVFKTARLSVNGHAIDGLACTGKNWKLPATAEVGDLLHTGGNNITVWVTNSIGPPALWLRLEAEPGALGSDAAWTVSFADGPWQNARLAATRPTIPKGSPLYDPESTLGSLRRVWPVLAIFSLASVALVLGIGRWRRQPATAAASHRPAILINILFGFVVIARAALFYHNLPRLPYWAGFDAQAHAEYVQFIEDNHQLPLPNQGWEMFQPPLYYAGSALLLGVTGLAVGDDGGRMLLRAVNGLAGLAQCWLALLCLRRLFPGNFSAQAVGLLVAALLPPHLYLSMYVTNEALSGLLVSLAFYCCLRLVQAEQPGVAPYLLLGLALGGALLTKVSALLAAPLFFLVAGGHLAGRKKHALPEWLRGPGVMIAAVAGVCGWYYAWIWARFGRPVVANWDKVVGVSWWQDTGYTTSAYFFSFGQSLARPLFSGFHSFADGIYSTLWGDGLIGSLASQTDRPPWNYDLMNLLYLASLPLTLLAAAGFVMMVWRLIRQPRWEWFLATGLVAVFGLGIIYMTLQVPSYAQAKAFYGFPALLAFSALLAAGWSRLAQANGCLRTILWSVVVVWALTAYSTFWISDDNYETWRDQAHVQVSQRRCPEAIASAARALQLKPDDFESHCYLAKALTQLGRTSEALGQCELALQLEPGDADMNNLRVLNLQQMSAKLAVTNLTSQLATNPSPQLHLQLADAQCFLGNYPEAMAQWQAALALAPNSLEGLNSLAWLLATCSDASLRDGHRAIPLAGRACQLTKFQTTDYVSTLAAAFAEAGQFDDAIAAGQKACELATARGETKKLQRNQELLALYQKHKAWHQGGE